VEECLYNFLSSVAEILFNPELPSGCMLANSTCESAGEGIPPAANDLISELNGMAIERLSDFFAREQAQGTIRSDSSPHALALYLISVNSGMAVLARNGATPSELDEMIDHVVATLI
jgi:hypothetical protein